LIAAPPDEATSVALDFDERRWPSVNIDPYDTALHVLVGHLTGRTTREVFASLRDLTPKLEGSETAEPWDERFWVACVHQLPGDWVAAIVNVQDDAIPSLVAWWFGIEEFGHYRTYARGFTEAAVAEDFRRIRGFLDAAGGQSLLMRLST
jgi:hypothetical protein